MAVLLALVLTVTGLHGVVTRGPTMPVCKVSTECSQPAVGAVLVFSRSGMVAARVHVGAGGRYAVRLPPGVYTVRLSPPQRIGGLQPSRVNVVAAVNRRADFQIDTGIR
jgi:hypothetical protein